MYMYIYIYIHIREKKHFCSTSEYGEEAELTCLHACMYICMHACTYACTRVTCSDVKAHSISQATIELEPLVGL